MTWNKAFELGPDDIPDSDHWLAVCGAEGKVCLAAQLKLTDDSEGHGRPYWSTAQGDLEIIDYPYWLYLPGEEPAW